jgi:hypothetical protein
MAKNKIIKLDCGIEAEYWKSGKTERLRISVIDLYNGYGELNNLKKLSELFAELAAKGFKGDGLSREIGYYDSTDDLLLDVCKSL